MKGKKNFAYTTDHRDKMLLTREYVSSILSLWSVVYAIFFVSFHKMSVALYLGRQLCV